MPAPSPQKALLAESRNLLELGRAARTLGLQRRLDEPIGVLAASGKLSTRALSLVAALAGSGDARTLGDLLSQGPAERWLNQHATSRMRQQLLEAAKSHLADALDERAPAPPPGLPPLPGSEEELRRFAVEQEVESLLSRPVRVLGEALPPQLLDTLLRWRSRATVGDAALAATWDRSGVAGELGPAGVELLALSALRYLLKEGEALRRGREEEVDWERQPPPEDELSRRLVDGLLSLRRLVRERVDPRAGPSPLLDFEPDPPAIVAEAEPRIFPPSRGRPAEVRLDLSRFRQGEIRASCSCDEAPCVHILSTIDAALRLLLDPAAEGARRSMLEELSVPSWSRALRAIDELRAKRQAVAQQEPSVRLAWRLSLEDHWVLRPYLQKRRQRGWSQGSRVSWRELAPRQEELSATDRAALAALIPGELADAGAIPEHHLAPRVPAAMRALAGHPRVFYDGESQPLQILEARIGLQAIESGAGVEMQPMLGGEPISWDAIFRLVSRSQPGELALRVDAERRRALLVPVDEEAIELLRILHRHGALFPKEHVDELLLRVAPLEERMPLRLPDALRGEEVAPMRTVVLRMEPLDGPGLRVEARVRVLPQSPSYPPGEGPSEVAAAVEGRRFFAKRRKGEEPARVREALAPLQLREDAEELPFVWILDRGDEALELLARLKEHDELVVEWPGQRRAVHRIDGSRLRVSVQRTRDWFGLEGGVEVDGEQVRLALLLEAARRGARWVEVRDGLWVKLEEELLSRLSGLSEHVADARGRAVAGLAAMEAIESLGEIAAEYDPGDELPALLERKRRSTEEEYPLPEGLAASLRPYQVEGYRWLRGLASWGAGGCLADDMGLGKTVQALAVLLARAEKGPQLVVAPTSVCGNWIEETRRFAPSLRPQLYREDRGRSLEDFGPGDLVIASYGLVARDVERFAERPFATLVVDEAQAVKNPATQRARALRRIDADFRFALTGTPIENHLGELWSLFHLVFPSLFGSWPRFRDRFATPIEKAGDVGRKEALSRVISPFLLRRKKDEVARELPPRIEVEVPVELSVEERRLYEDVRLAAVGQLEGMAKGPEARRFEVLAAITRLRLCASHPRLCDPHSSLDSSKLHRLLELIEELRGEGHRALVFSQFTSHLSLVREALDEAGVRYLYLDGSTPPAERDALVRRFQAGEGELFLISLKAGGTGLNLTAASYVIHLDPWWNPAVEDQATDRAHRIGQDKPVTVVRLVSKETIEESILRLHGEKRALVTGILEGAPPASLGVEELFDLLRS